VTFAAPVHNKSIRFRARSFVAFTLTPEAPLDVWLESLDHWIGNSPGYFTGRPVLLDLNTLKPGPEELVALVGALGRRGIRVYAIELEGAELGPELPPVLTGAREATTEGFLPPQPPQATSDAAAGQAKGDGAEGKPAAAKETHGNDNHAAGADDAATARIGGASAGVAAAQAAGTLMVTTPLRSGQSIVHPHGDVIVLGSVASGSEIVAAGSIHVYGTLRGRAMAGAQGNGAARIFCRKNEAELLAIDGWYTTAEEMEGTSRGKAVQAFLENDVLRVVPLN